MRQRGAESKPSLSVRLRIAEIHQPFSVNIVSHPMTVARQPDVIPMVRFQQMRLVGIFPKDGRTLCRVADGSLIAVVPAEARGRVMIAAVAHIVEPQGIAVQEHAAALLHPAEDIVGIFRVTGHPEAIQVAQPVGGFIATVLHHHTGIIFYRYAPLHLLLSPERQSLWRDNVSCIAPERHPIVSRFRLYHPMPGKLLPVQRRRRLAGSTKCHQPTPNTYHPTPNTLFHT